MTAAADGVVPARGAHYLGLDRVHPDERAESKEQRACNRHLYAFRVQSTLGGPGVACGAPGQQGRVHRGGRGNLGRKPRA